MMLMHLIYLTKYNNYTTYEIKEDSGQIVFNKDILVEIF